MYPQQVSGLEQIFLVVLVGLLLLVLIGLLNLTLNLLMELLNLLHPFASFSAQTLFGVDRSKIKGAKRILAVNDLEW